MCGIFGVIGKERTIYQPDTLTRMEASLGHRGPEDQGTVIFDEAILGQTRLSIVDLSPSGHQPMKDNEGRYTITFNGEIYNYQELRASLEAQGHHFSTQSDTEVILKAYRAYGSRCPEYLDGMFAFAIWDEETKTVFAARDRFGKKPFYYTQDDHGNFLFASEIKGLFASGRIVGELSLEAIHAYLRFGYLPPWRSIYQNIHPLLPAHGLLFSEGTIRVFRYWQLERKPLTISYPEAKEEVVRLLKSAVDKRLIADVEIGSLLSGGVDSSLVTGIAASLRQTPLKTFSAGFDTFINELPFAAEAAQAFRTDHAVLHVKNELLEEISTILAQLDEPLADSSIIPQYFISRFAKKHVKVVLSGDGADELFLGYGWYTKHQHLSWRKDFLEKWRNRPFEAHLKHISHFSSSELKTLEQKRHYLDSTFLHQESLGEDFSVLSGIEQINRFDLTHYLSGDILTKVDRASMAHGLEVRSPFLDQTLATFVYNLPLAYKTDGTQTKILLKDLLCDLLPPSFVHRRKQGFNAPISAWLKQPQLRTLVTRALQPQAMLCSFLDAMMIKDCLRRFYETNDQTFGYRVWILFCLEHWLISHKDQIRLPTLAFEEQRIK